MTKRNESRARRTALVTAAATLALWGSFGSAVHADDEPVAEPPVETGDVGGATVAVGPPPVPPTSVVVAVGPAPVPPTSVVVAVGPPPVPPTSVVVAVGPPPVPPTSVVVAVGPPPVPPAPVTPVPVAAPVAPNPIVAAPAPQVARPHAMRQAVGVSDQLTEAFADMIATIEAALALINSQL